MRARFLDGPYKGIRLHVDKAHETVILPVNVSVPDRYNLEGIEPIGCHAHYEKTWGDDYEGTFKFVGLLPDER